METKNLILAVVLSGAVFFVSSLLTPKRAPSPPVETAGQGTSVEQGLKEVLPPVPVGTGGDSGRGPSAVPATKAVLENDRIQVEISSVGAAVVRATLKDFREKPGREGVPVAVLGGAHGGELAGDSRLASGALSLGAPFREVERGAGKVVYVWDSPSGVQVEKSYTLEQGQYDLRLSVVIRNLSGAPIKDELGIALVQDYGKEDDNIVFTGPTFLKGADVSQVKVGDLKKKSIQEVGEIQWAALLQKYFLVALVPIGTAGGGVKIDRYKGQEKVLAMELDSGSFELAMGGDRAFSYRLYLGPKLGEALSPLGSKLDRVIDYGWFSAIGRPLLLFLKAIYRVTGNYGLAIIVLTTVVKAVFWPLSAKSFRSMQKMKDLQPKMQKLRERYAKDRERLNMEVMQLYKTHKVNPLGGCLPMLVQIPVFFALYKVLGSAIELRHAPFVFWITDLSVKDPYYVTPLVMGVTMFIQQKMTPATGMDPMQAKMMQYGMPVVFTFMFLNFASGLVLYWLINNVLSIVQQGMMMRQAGAEAK